MRSICRDPARRARSGNPSSVSSVTQIADRRQRTMHSGALLRSPRSLFCACPSSTTHLTPRTSDPSGVSHQQTRLIRTSDIRVAPPHPPPCPPALKPGVLSLARLCFSVLPQEKKMPALAWPAQFRARSATGSTGSGHGKPHRKHRHR